MNTIICRKLNENDYDNFHRLINDFRETTFTLQQFQDVFSKINTTSDVIVLEYNNILIATGTIIYEYKFIFNICCLAHIEDVCVKKDMRNMGYGKIIINKLITLAKEKKCYKISLDCSDLNCKFYEKCNFEKRGNQMCILLTN